VILLNNKKMNYEIAVKNIRSELEDYIIKNKLKSLVMGISGGIDSTLCVLLAKPVCDELKIPLIGRSLPTITNSRSENGRAKSVGRYFCTNFKETSIQAGFTAMYDLADKNCEGNYKWVSDTKHNILAGNIKARIRMILLYDIAGATEGLVLSTDNYTEYLLGFWTLHGDVGDYGMIQNLWKTEVYEMTEWIMKNELINVDEQTIVESVINADATDGLGISKTDLDQILPGWEGSSRKGYEQVDKELQSFTSFGTGSLDSPVLHRMHRTEFKRKNPVNIPWSKIVGIDDKILNK